MPNTLNMAPEKSQARPDTVEMHARQYPAGDIIQRLYNICTWTPTRCRWDPQNPPKFGIAMNLLFGLAGTFTVANLYYNQPILNILAESFHVSYETSSHVPTLAQSGYCAGLFLLCPLGDLVRRRAFTLSLIFFTATVWIGLCLTRSFIVFQILSFVTGFTTVTPQIMLPLVGDLAPAHKRARSLSIVASGNVAGILIARILSGVVTNYINWRIIYWIALGLQYTIFSLLFCFMPDYPPTNTSKMPYYRLLWDVVRLPFKYPVLMQSGLIGLCTSATFTSFWTTLTFLLAGSPYHFSPTIIGLFALINISALVLTPVYARLFIERYVPTLSVIIGQMACLIGVVIGTFTGRFTVAGPIIFALFLDAGFLVTAIANRSAIYSCVPKGRNRVNTSFMVLSFLGQVMGTSAGNRLYARHGWIASGSLSIGLIAFSLFLVALRGPYEDRWIGWRGGASMKKRDKMSADGRPSSEVAQSMPDVHSTEGIHEELEKGNIERALDEAAGVNSITTHGAEDQSIEMGRLSGEDQASKKETSIHSTEHTHQ